MGRSLFDIDNDSSTTIELVDHGDTEELAEPFLVHLSCMMCECGFADDIDGFREKEEDPITGVSCPLDISMKVLMGRSMASGEARPSLMCEKEPFRER